VTEARPGVGVEQVGGPGEGARLPAAVVVAEGHVPAPDPLHGQVAAQRPQVGPAADQGHLREGGGHGVGGAVAGGVVDDRDRRPVRQRGHAPERGRQLLAPVVVMTTTVVRFVHCELHVGAL
jgi:hypothetical protein